MLVFEIHRNGRRCHRAGAEDMEDLFATLAWIAHPDAKGRPGGTRRAQRPAVWLRVTGRTSHSYRAWRRISLEMGDEITIKLIAADAAAAPVEDEEDAAHALARERWERKRYLALKEKFKPDSKRRRSHARAGGAR